MQALENRDYFVCNRAASQGEMGATWHHSRLVFSDQLTLCISDQNLVDVNAGRGQLLKVKDMTIQAWYFACKR